MSKKKCVVLTTAQYLGRDILAALVTILAVVGTVGSIVLLPGFIRWVLLANGVTWSIDPWGGRIYGIQHLFWSCLAEGWIVIFSLIFVAMGLFVGWHVSKLVYHLPSNLFHWIRSNFRQARSDCSWD